MSPIDFAVTNTQCDLVRLSNDPSWDAIVIGSGLGGLTAAAAIANRGKRVLVLERHASFGGAATVHRHGALSIEGSLHEIDGDTVYGAHGPIARLDLTGSVEPIATDVFNEARGAILPTVRVPHGLEAAHETLARAMPHSRRALKRFFEEANRLHRSFHDLEELGARGPVVLAGLILSGRLFEILMHSRRSLHQRLEAIFGNDDIPKIVLGAPISHFDDDPRKLSCLLYPGIWTRYVEAGSFYFKGGSSALTAALVKHIHDRDGEYRQPGGAANVARIFFVLCLGIQEALEQQTPDPPRHRRIAGSSREQAVAATQRLRVAESNPGLQFQDKCRVVDLCRVPLNHVLERPLHEFSTGQQQHPSIIPGAGLFEEFQLLDRQWLAVVLRACAEA